ncbi:MAG: DegT/DnrJ/EryC1/StrS family aminotransferase [Spirochaetes bacterium]|jgi:perosamine synthetase|nr:DegT/DnrJ/EryC1/StrS family aminotransferase [Spirochaetota bacterium]
MTISVPFHKPHITDAEIEAVAAVLRSGWLTMGPKTVEFEESFRVRIGAAHAIAVSSATAALHLALVAAGIGEGDEVIVPAMTFASSAEVVRYQNAVVVMADIERDTHLLDARRLEEKITPRTRAVMPVHYGGLPCDMDRIMDIARRRGLVVIEDAAHSLPAEYHGKTVGIIGDFTCFSFYATKTLAVGEGGMITTENADWAERLRSLRLHGIGKDAWKRYSVEGSWAYDVTEIGYKYNMTDISAAIGVEQLKKLDWMNGRRAAVASAYDVAFAGADALVPYGKREGRSSAWHLYPLRLNLDALSIDRARFIVELKERGIGASVHFIPLYRFMHYQKMGYRAADFPECEWAFEREVSLPIYPGMGDDAVNVVIEAVLAIIQKFRR